MKKTLAILTLVVMLATLIVPVAMAMVEATAACDHPGSYVASETFVGPRYYNSTQHGYCTKRIARCTSCNEVLTTSYANWTGFGYHSTPGGVVDLGHDYDRGKHSFAGNCSICNSSYTITRTCSGPPCPAY